MSYQNIKDKLYERLNKKHQKVIEGKIPEIRDSDIYRSLPDSDDVFQDQTAIKVIKEKTGISYQEIAESLNRLIEKCKLVTSFDTRNRLYLRKTHSTSIPVKLFLSDFFQNK
jgi:hypothetical protein